ncbi:MAG: ATP-binding cassette domain-containing protein [Candidatus Eisenbacteria bacterium]|nr:ATP-binding cassette domain-containing protein [Candidatus Eisenbacteria bacterium]
MGYPARVNSTSVVEIRALVKRYGDFEAVRGIDLTVGPRECVGILGPNGAGKTTTVRVLACASPPTSGEVRVLGMDVAREPRRIKARLGICPQENNTDPDFHVLNNLVVYGRYFGIPRREAEMRARELLEWMNLGHVLRHKISELSGGMVRRLVLARALLNRPDLLLLDEPTTGLDPQARHAIWDLVRDLKRRGVTILITTHYMEEASQLCDRVVFVDGGRILLEGRPGELVEREVGREVVECWHYGPEVPAWAAGRGLRHEESAERLFFYPGDDSGALPEFEERFPHQERLLRLATLEDVFLKLTGRVLRD